MSRPAKCLGSDLVLAFASLAIAFAIWMISKRGDLTLETFSVPVRLKNVPANVQVRIEPEQNRAKITLPIPIRERSRIQADLFCVECDFLKAFPEPRTWCGTGDFRSPPTPMDPQGATIQVASADEDLRRRIARHLESATIDGSLVLVKGKLITRPADLDFQTKGELLPGYREVEIKAVDQGTIPLTASPEVFRALTGNDEGPVVIETEEIDLTGQRKSFESTVELRLPPDVELVYPNEHRRIKAQVLIEEIAATEENAPVSFPAPGTEEPTPRSAPLPAQEATQEPMQE